MEKPYYELYETHVFQPKPGDVHLVGSPDGPQLEWKDEHGQRSVLIISEPTVESMLETRNALIQLADHYMMQRAALEAYLDGLSEEE